MPEGAIRARRPGRSPINLIAVLGAIAVASAASLVFLGWKLLQQDAALATQREQERLEHDADRVVQVFERQLSDVGSSLAAQKGTPDAHASKLPDFGVVVVLTSSGIAPVAPGRLLFRPVVQHQPEPPEALFAEAEQLEFQRQDYEQAGTAFHRLAETSNSGIRAASLMRLARVQRTAGRLDAALKTFEEMKSIAGAAVFDRPADLVARSESARLLQQTARTTESRAAAVSILEDLAAGRWALTRGQYEAIIEDVAGLAGRPVPAATNSILSAAASDLWNEWRSNSSSRDVRVIHPGGVPVLAIQRESSNVAAAWLVEPRELMARLELDPSIAVTLTDGDGEIASFAAGSTPEQDRTGSSNLGIRTVRASVDTRLPWTMHVTRLGTGAAESGAQRTLIAGGLVLMLVFLGTGFVFIGRAIRRETDLARAQSDFVAAVSHEFRTPLAAMRQFSELLAAGRVPTPDKRQHYYESLAGESRRLQKLVENLLNFGRLEAGTKPFNLGPVDLRELVTDVVDDYQSQLSRPDCHIEIDGSREATMLRADKDAVSLALHNLIDNAVKYSGGKPVQIDWMRHEGQVAVSVRDQGPGIAPDEQDRIFERFVRGAAAASVRGTGIGLAMVKLVAMGHGGDVQVTSEPGAGATFTMLLPMEPGVFRPRES